jgi:hypothetical protein
MKIVVIVPASLLILSWVLTLLLGGIGHQMAVPYLFKFGYWECFLSLVGITIVGGAAGALRTADSE